MMHTRSQGHTPMWNAERSVKGCFSRENKRKTISYKDVENMGFSDKVVSLANDLYSQVTKEKIYRGNSRKAIVFACIFHAYKIMGKPQSCENLQSVFSKEDILFY